MDNIAGTVRLRTGAAKGTRWSLLFFVLSPRATLRPILETAHGGIGMRGNTS